MCKKLSRLQSTVDNNANVLCVSASWLWPYCWLVAVYVYCGNILLRMTIRYWILIDFCRLTTKRFKGINGLAFVQFACRQLVEVIPWAMVRQAWRPRPVERRRRRPSLRPLAVTAAVSGAGVACCCAASLYNQLENNIRYRDRLVAVMCMLRYS